MKIALAIFKYFPYGGLQLDFIRIARELLRRGHDVTVFTRSFEGERPEGLKVETIKLSSWSNHGKAAEFGQIFNRTAVGFDLKFTFNRIPGADFYFAADNCVMSEALAAYPRWFLKISPRHRALLQQEKAVLAPCGKTRIFYIAEKQKLDYQKFYGTEEERFFYLPPGLNDACFRTSEAESVRRNKREALGIRENEILLILIGSFFEGKGADRLLRAVGALPAVLKEKCKIAIVGNMPQKPCLKLCRQVGIAPGALIMPGSTNDVPEWLQAADLMVHPARKESAGSVIAEALAAGVPVIASGECGFAPFAAESGGCALQLPFAQQELDRTLTNFLQPEKLAQLKKDAIAYGEKADFRRRASAAVDILEQYHG